MKRTITVLGVLIGLAGTVVGEQLLPIPKTPEGDLSTELMQCRAYCVSMTQTLDLIEARFPELAVNVLGARSAWQASPFASGCRSIEEAMISDAGESARKALRAIDEATQKEVLKHLDLKSEEKALAFLDLVYRRSLGEIEVEMVQGNLLWQHIPYQEEPEKEFSDGFTKAAALSSSTGMEVTWRVPMSWKADPVQKEGLMTFRNCYGHGNIWMTVTAGPTMDDAGNSITGIQAFDRYSEESLRASYQELGIELTSFQKTKLNGHPALLFTRRQLYEQLGQRATRAAEAVRVFHGNSVISFQINTLGPEGQAHAEERIKKNSALFRLICASLLLTDTR